GAEEDFADIFRETDDGEDDVRARGDFLRGGGVLRPDVQERLSLLFTAVIDCRGVAFLDDVLAHPASHDAGADPADSCFSGRGGGEVHCVGSMKGLWLPDARFAKRV